MKIKKSILTLFVVGGIVIGWLTLGGAYSALRLSSTTEFCVSCHSMATPYEEYQNSIHFSNAKGIRAECADCHIPPAPLDYLMAKLRASKDIYHEFVTGKIDTPEKYEERRAGMAATVWDELKANDSATCRSCHNEAATELYDQSQEAQKMHQYGRDNGQTCIECHKGVAHIPPEMQMDSKAFDQLIATAEQTPEDSREVYPPQAIPMGDLGMINPGTTLRVLASEGEKRTVQLTGFQMEGAEQLLYLGEGQRAIIATLSEAGQQAVQAGAYRADQYDNKWRSATLTAEIVDPVLASRAPLWAYAEQLDNVYCATCHARIPSQHFTLNAWPSVAKGMGERTSIGPEDLEILTKYFQYNAKQENTTANH